MYALLNIPHYWFLFAINFIQDYDLMYPNLEAALGCICTQFSNEQLIEIKVFINVLIVSDFTDQELQQFWHDYSKADFRPIEGTMRENFSEIIRLIDKHKETPLICQYK